MANIITYFNQKFEKNPNLPAVSESFEALIIDNNCEQTHEEKVKASEKDRAAYELWKRSATKQAVTEWLYEQFQKHSRTPKQTHEGIDFKRTGISKGFRMHPALTTFSDKTTLHFWTYMAECLMNAGYRTAISDTRLYNRDNYWMETVHRHVLRPANEADWQETHFAEIRMEALLKDGHLCYIELHATIPVSEVPRSSCDFADMMETFLN
jgi:hypothetical protein